MGKIKRYFIFIFLIYLATWLPWLFVRIGNYKDIHFAVDGVPVSDTAVVFGGLHTQGEKVTETNQERLLAAKALLDGEKVDKILISNAEVASMAMRDFLIMHGVANNDLVLDSEALVTSDTCQSEEIKVKDTKFVFVSHGYHLPRIIFQCKKLGITGSGFAPDKLNLIEREKTELKEKIQTRFFRYQREAFLTFASVLGIYK